MNRALLSKLGAPHLPLHFEGQVVYVQLPMGTVSAPSPTWFLIDTGTTQSYVDASLVSEQKASASAARASVYYPERFDFFGSWAKTGFRLGDYSKIKSSVRQGGILGTDFLSLHPLIFDYEDAKLYRSTGYLNCSYGELSDAGLVALSTHGYYSNIGPSISQTYSFLVPNVPTIPIRIGNQNFHAQIDSGYNDSKYPFSININVAMKNALDLALVPLIAIPELDSTLSTCVPGVRDQVTAFKLGSATSFSFVDVSGQAINEYPHVTLFLKTTPPEAKVCGGISTWDQPAAQLGASFLKNLGFVVIDPLTSLIWIPKATE